MCDPVTIAVTTIAVSGGMQAYGQYQQGKAQAGMYNYQAALAVQEAETTRKYAEEQAKATKGYSDIQKTAIAEAAATNVSVEQAAAAEESRRLASDVGILSGSQRVMMGALGIGGVTAADIVGSTFDKAQLDQMAIRYNANIKSWSIREQAKRDIWTLGEGTKYNLWSLGEETKLKTWSLKSQATQYRSAAKQAKTAGKRSSATTLLNTAASMAMAGTMMAKSPAYGDPTGGASNYPGGYRSMAF